MFIYEQSKKACGAARNESRKMHVKATNCVELLIVVYNNATTEFLPTTQIIEQPFL
jgi:hypothetical protein